MQKKKSCLLSLCLISIAFFIALVFAVSPPDVNLLSPNNGAVFNTTNNINFSCNATTNATLRKIDLYTTLNGSFSKTNTSCFGELCADSSTALLFHFNNNSLVGENGTLVYDWSGNGNNATVTGASFNASGGKFGGAFEFDGTNNTYIKINDSDILDLSPAGSIEFWMKANKITGDVWYLLLKGPATQSPPPSYYMYLQSGKLSLILNDAEYISGAIINSPNAWYHIAATWNGSWVRVYINGALNISQSQSNAVPINNNELWIGATEDSSSKYLNGTIDELALYNRALSAEEVSEHYNRTFVNNATKNWTMNDVSDGTYSWTCKAEDNESQSAWGANRTFYIDLHTPPDVNSIMLSPNSTDDVDPGITINVTANVTDPGGVGTVFFQYENPWDPPFKNITMAYDGTSKLYKTSFTPPLLFGNGLWKYKIWSNDTLGNSNTSSEAALSVEFDLTWKLSIMNISGNNASIFGSISAPNGTITDIGTVTINNTGDGNLTFDLSYTPTSPDIKMTYNVPEPFVVLPKNTTSFNVSATTPNEIYEWPILLIINTSANATPSSATVTGFLVPFRGGPYLEPKIQSYVSTASHGQQITLTATIKNLGNETATDVWANWTLPGGWDITAGNKSAFLGNVTSGSTTWSNITVTLNPSTATLGTFVDGISITASSAENISKTDSKTVSVVCTNSDSVCGAGCSYSTDSDCPAPTTTSGGGGGGTTTIQGASTAYVQKYSMELGAAAKIDAYRGTKARFRINVSNPEKGTRLESIVMSISGYPAVHISIKPPYFNALNYGDVKEFEAEIGVPAYMKYGPYALSVSAAASGKSNFTENSTLVEAAKAITFIVRSATENETLSILGEAAKSIEPLAALNITTPKILQVLEDARASLKEWDYDTAKELAGKALEAGKSAAKSYGSLRQVESAISEADKYGVDARETKKMYSLAEAAFERGDYARAEERAKNAMLAAAIEVSAKVSILKFIHTYYRGLILASAMLAFALFFIYRKIAAGLIKKEISLLEKEEETIRALISGAKKEYFEKRAITKEEYRRTIYGYETRLNKIKKERSQKILRLAGIARPKKIIEGFKKEEKRILGLIEAAQRDYFDGGKISKTHYDGTMKELNAELAEVRLGIELAGRKAGKNKPLALALLAALVLMLLGAGAHAAGDAAGAAGAIRQAESDIIEMQKADFGIALANDTLNEARLLYANGNYAGAGALAKYVGSIKKTAISTYALVDDAEGKIFEAGKEGLNVADAKNEFDAGINALENSDYPGAEELLNSALAKADKALADAAMEEALGKSWLRDAKDFAWQKKKQIAVLLVSLAVIFAAAEKKYRSMKRMKHIRRLEGEEKAASQMIQGLQKKYFLDGIVGRAEYASKVKRYGEIILRAKKDISVLKGAEKKNGKA